ADVTFTVSGGTPPGTTGNDYTVTPVADAMGAYTLAVTPNSGMTTATGTITLTQVDDNLLENDETVTVTLTAAASSGTATVSATAASATAALASDDMAEVSIARAMDNDGFTEGASGSAGQTSFTVSLGAALPGNVTIPFTVSGTGISAADYDISAPSGIMATATGGNIVINAGATSGTITIDASSDTLLEGAETLTVELGASITGGGTLPGLGPVTVTRSATAPSATADIADANSATVAIADGADFTEGASGAGGMSTLTVSITGATTTAQTTVDFTVTGCGSGGAADCSFAPSGGTLTMNAGAASGDIVLTQQNDDLNEPDETITVAITGATSSGVTLTATDSSGTATLQDDDDITVTISRASGESGREGEAGEVNFTVALSGGVRVGALTVPFSITGDLLAAEYDITAPSGIPAADTGGDVVFPAADPTASPPVAATATDSMTITVDLIDDDLNEARETLIVTGTAAGATGLRTANGGAVAFAGGGGNTESVGVNDDDDIALTLAAAAGTDTDTADPDLDVVEGTTVTLTVTMDHASAANVSVAFSSEIGAQANMGDAMDSDNDATTVDVNSGANPDFTAMGENSGPLSEGLVLVLAGETTADITIDINADRIREGAETLTVALTTSIFVATEGGVASLGSPVSVDLVIAPSTTSAHVISLASGNPATLDESAGATTFTITRSGPDIAMGTTLDVVWTFAAGDTAAADFEGSALPTGGTVTFATNETSKTFTIDPAEDTLAEGGADGAEEFMLALSEAGTLTEMVKNMVGGVQVVTSAATVEIVDPDDALVIAIDGSGSIGTAAEDTSSSTRTLTWRISVTGATST
ncbi:MAG: hypothetical protein OXU61_06825, partial [Gammaproteobacteria bacterium]|nr:hypothetical protein [Gammaproteobacteria bacterium]